MLRNYATTRISTARAQQALLLLAQALIVAGALTLAAKARIWLPGSPVPITLQTLVVLVAGAALPLGVSVAGVALYSAAATAGLPVLAGASLLGPTGGYVLGFLAAAAFLASCRPSSPALLFLRLLAAEAIIFTLGVLWLAAYSGQGWSWAVRAGLLPFLPGDLMKLAVAWLLLSAGQVLSARRR